EKSSLKLAGRLAPASRAFALAFTLGLALVFGDTFEFTFAFAMRLLFESLVLPPMFARKINTTTKPIPITATIPSPPRTHHKAFDFFWCTGCGIGDHWGGGGGAT